MNAQGSIAKETSISTLTINQHIITLDIPSSKNPPNNTKNPSSPHPTDSVAIEIGRQGQETCPICLGDYLPEELKCSLKCKHFFCSACLTEYLNVKINNNEVLDIPCPQSGCMEIFTEESAKEIIPSKEYEKYQYLVTRKIRLRERKKYCPQPGCLRPLNPVEGQKFTICECGAKICNACLRLNHEGKSCVEMIDPDFEKFAKENGVRCCMMCKTMIMKEDGCDQIKCAVCDYQWCWICGGKYDFFHACINPILPAEKPNDRIWKLKKSWKEGSVLKRIGMFLGIILLLPVLLVGFVIFLPAYYNDCLNLNTFEFERRKPIESVCIILGAMLFGLGMTPFTILMLIFWGFFFAFVFAIAFVVYWILFFIHHTIEFFKRKANKEPQKSQLKNRWRSGNPENFAYRPTNPHF